MLDASLAREDQVQEETSTSEQNIDLAESLQNSSNTNLNSQQSPRQDTPTNLSNIELAEKIEDLDFSDDKDQGLTVLDVVDSFQGSVQSSSVCKQTPLPENSRFLNITRVPEQQMAARFSRQRPLLCLFGTLAPF